MGLTVGTYSTDNKPDACSCFASYHFIPTVLVVSYALSMPFWFARQYDLGSSTGKMKRIKIVISGANVDHTTRYRWRGVDRASCAIGPLLLQFTDICRIEYLLKRIGIGVLGIKAKHNAVFRYKTGIGLGRIRYMITR
jgi:hypothetical protein